MCYLLPPSFFHFACHPSPPVPLTHPREIFLPRERAKKRNHLEEEVIKMGRSRRSAPARRPAPRR